MPAFEVQLKTHIGNPIDRITERYPSLRIWTWCNFIQDVHELESEDPKVLRAALEDWSGLSWARVWRPNCRRCRSWQCPPRAARGGG